MAEVRVSLIKVDVPYGTRIRDLIDVLEGLYLKNDDMYIVTSEELEFSLDMEKNDETNR